MLLFAATSLEKVKAVPPMFWVKAFGILAGIIIAVLILQKVAQVNKMLLCAIAFVTISVISITWVYERNEPKFMTWLVDPIANSGFFPTKGGYDIKQAQEPIPPGKKAAPPKSAPAR